MSTVFFFFMRLLPNKNSLLPILQNLQRLNSTIIMELGHPEKSVVESPGLLYRASCEDRVQVYSCFGGGWMQRQGGGGGRWRGAQNSNSELLSLLHPSE